MEVDKFLFIIAFCASLTIVTSIMPMLIIYFTNKKLGQMTREEGPTWHEVKAGTPTMGGIAFILSTLITTSVINVLNGYTFVQAWLLLLVMLAFSIIGFLDDYLKLIRQHNEGLTSKQKFFMQLTFSLFAMLLLFLSGEIKQTIPLALYVLFGIIWLTGFSNAVNLTDGLDGLSSGTSIIALSAYAWIAYQQQKMYIVYFSLALIGGLCGFFIFNKRPAKIFMGDVGSLALGSIFAMLSMLLHIEWSLLLIGIVFVLETASVMLQVFSYKTFKKRIFRMSPLHHHFEMGGWSEWRVVLTFWGVGLVGALIYLLFFMA